MSRLLSLVTLALIAGSAAAGSVIPVVGAPEIDANTAMAGMTLLLGGLTVLRSRTRK